MFRCSGLATRFRLYAEEYRFADREAPFPPHREPADSRSPRYDASIRSRQSENVKDQIEERLNTGPRRFDDPEIPLCRSEFCPANVQVCCVRPRRNWPATPARQQAARLQHLLVRGLFLPPRGTDFAGQDAHVDECFPEWSRKRASTPGGALPQILEDTRRLRWGATEIPQPWGGPRSEMYATLAPSRDAGPTPVPTLPPHLAGGPR